MVAAAPSKFEPRIERIVRTVGWRRRTGLTVRSESACKEYGFMPESKQVYVAVAPSRQSDRRIVHGGGHV